MKRILLAFLFILSCGSINLQAQYYVDPQKGNDTNDGSITFSFKTIDKAREMVRTLNQSMSRDIVVYLRSGVYPVTSTLYFNESDGGSNGYKVIYQAYPGETPVLDGGIKITGWKNIGGGKWKASGIPSDNFRQLYVNGQRANRARSEIKYTGIGWPKPYTSFTDDNWELEKQFYPDGIILSKKIIQTTWKNPEDIELVWIGEESKCTWRSYRLLVNSLISAGEDSTVIKLDNYGYALTSVNGGCLPENPFYIENAYELLDNPGEWYFNRTTRELFYIPREGENMKTAEVFIPGSVETILSIKGMSLSDKAQNLVFDGLTFTHTTWLRPSSSRLGACSIQADKYINSFGQIGRAHMAIFRKESFFDPAYDYVVDSEDEAEGFKPDACIELNAAENIVFQNCRFEHLGAVGIDLTQGCNDIAIIGNRFFDLSATSIVIGRWDQDYISPKEEVCKNVKISNNFISKTGQEYYNSPGITAFYTDGMIISHNEIIDIPYSGISSGWGSWSGKTSWTTSNRRNVIEYNLIKDISKLCSDGGGVYTVGIGKSRTDADSITSKIRYNYFSGMGYSYGALYPDEGSCYYELDYNVCEDVGQTGESKWLHLWSLNHHNIKVDGNFSNTSKFINKGINCPLTNHTIYEGHNRPAGALEIINKAGLQKGYESLRIINNQ